MPGLSSIVASWRRVWSVVGAGVALPCALAEQARYRVCSRFDFPGRCESRCQLLCLLGVLCMQWLCPRGGAAGGSGDAVVVSSGGSGEYVPSVVPDWVFWSSASAVLM